MLMVSSLWVIDLASKRGRRSSVFVVPSSRLNLVMLRLRALGSD